jgi:ribosomal protein L2
MILSSKQLGRCMQRRLFHRPREVTDALMKKRNKNYKKPAPHPHAEAHYVYDDATGLPMRRELPAETKFWRIKDGFKVFKPISPGLRFRKEPALLDHWKGDPISRLAKWKSYSGGRNNTGKITTRGRGGGGPRLLRDVDFTRRAPGPQVVVRLEKDPHRSGTLALLRHLATNEFSYIVAPDGVVPGEVVESFRDGLPVFSDADGISKSAVLKRGNCLKLRDIPVGTVVHCIGLKGGGRAQLCRAAGTFGQIISAENDMVQIKLQSGEVRNINMEAIATIGTVGNSEHHRINRGKAGVNRNRGFRPKVRGVAMNPNNHPHGGMRNKQGNRHPVSIWGWHTKVRIKRYILIQTRASVLESVNRMSLFLDGKIANSVFTTTFHPTMIEPVHIQSKQFAINLFDLQSEDSLPSHPWPPIIPFLPRLRK